MTQKAAHAQFGPVTRRTARPDTRTRIIRESNVPDFLGKITPCKKMDPDSFTTTDQTKKAYRQRAEAAAACGTCPFTKECLQWGMDQKLTGVFGGKWLFNGNIATEESGRMIPKGKKK